MSIRCLEVWRILKSWLQQSMIKVGFALNTVPLFSGDVLIIAIDLLKCLMAVFCNH